MNTHTWALILFTILAQMSVGSFIVLGIVHFFAARKEGMEQADMLSDRALIAILVILVLGMIASLFHLGDPVGAYRAVLHFSTSWLSREITFGVTFAVIGGIFVLLQWLKLGSAVARNIVAWLAAIAGLALVFSMSQVYMIEPQIAWNTLATPISFFATTLLLGSLALAAAFMVNYSLVKQKEDADCQQKQCDLLRSASKWIAIMAIVLLGVELVVASLNSAYLVSIQEQGGMNFLGEFGLLFAIRLVLGFVGAVVFGVFLYQNAAVTGKEKSMAAFAYGAFAFCFAAEIISRFLFYATQISVGL